jgi:hypothetical protein
MGQQPARIVYLSWPAKEITGGIKQAFIHVEALRAAGLEAAVATVDAEPPGWFETTAPMIDLAHVVRDNDILVFPENHHVLLAQFASWANHKAVFCQGWHAVIRGLGGRRDYSEFGIEHILCAGRYAANYCRTRFSSMPVDIVPVSVDPRRFGLPAQKKLQIACAPRKRGLEAAFIRDLFRAAHPQYRPIPWVEIRDTTEAQTAAILGASAVYLSLCRFETCPLSILEAMASGCIIAGFTGLGARQYTTDRNGFWAEEDDCIQCTEKLVEAVRLATEGGAQRSDLLEAAHVTASYYSPERLARSVVGFWRNFTKR